MITLSPTGIVIPDLYNGNPSGEIYDWQKLIADGFKKINDYVNTNCGGGGGGGGGCFDMVDASAYPSLQSAFDAIPNGGTIYCPAGSYALTATYTLPAGRRFRIVGTEGAKIVISGGSLIIPRDTTLFIENVDVEISHQSAHAFQTTTSGSGGLLFIRKSVITRIGTNSNGINLFQLHTIAVVMIDCEIVFDTTTSPTADTYVFYLENNRFVYMENLRADMVSTSRHYRMYFADMLYFMMFNSFLRNCKEIQLSHAVLDRYVVLANNRIVITETGNVLNMVRFRRGKVLVSNCHFSAEHTSKTTWHPIAVHASDATFVNCMFNRIRLDVGVGGIVPNYTPTVSVVNNTFIESQKNVLGGYGNIYVAENNFMGWYDWVNTSYPSDYGVALWVVLEAWLVSPSGSAPTSWDKASQIVIKNNTFVNYLANAIFITNTTGSYGYPYRHIYIGQNRFVNIGAQNIINTLSRQTYLSGVDMSKRGCPIASSASSVVDLSAYMQAEISDNVFDRPYTSFLVWLNVKLNKLLIRNNKFGDENSDRLETVYPSIYIAGQPSSPLMNVEFDNCYFYNPYFDLAYLSGVIIRRCLLRGVHNTPLNIQGVTTRIIEETIIEGTLSDIRGAFPNFIGSIMRYRNQTVYDGLQLIEDYFPKGRFIRREEHICSAFLSNGNRPTFTTYQWGATA